MINEALVQSIVRGVIESLEARSQNSVGVTSCQAPPDQPSYPPRAVTELYKSYCARYLNDSSFEEKFSVELDSSLAVELGRSLPCIYEAHRPCDSCGRCQVRGF